MRQLQATLTRIFIVLVSESHGFFVQNQKFESFFSPKTGDLQKKKKKKRSSSEVQTLFQADSRQLLHSFGTQILLEGGCFHFFTKNRPQKHQKRAILHTLQDNGGRLEPPPASSPLVTLLNGTPFFPNSNTDLRSDAHQSQIIGGDADEDHTQIVGGYTVKLLGGMYPPRVSAPLAFTLF